MALGDIIEVTWAMGTQYVGEQAGLMILHYRQRNPNAEGVTNATIMRVLLTTLQASLDQGSQEQSYTAGGFINGPLKADNLTSGVDEVIVGPVYKGGLLRHHVGDPRTSILVRKNSSVRGRSYKGHCYIPLPFRSNYQDGLYDSTKHAFLQNTVVSSWRSIYVSVGNTFMDMVVRSRKLEINTIVNTLTVDKLVYTQRGRWPRRPA